MNLGDHEILRTRWRRNLQSLALDSTARNDFGRSRLSQRLSEITVQMVLLPADPEANVAHIDDSFCSWLDEHRAVDLDGRTFMLPQVQRRTAHAIALIETYGESWAQYFAVHRSGAIEIGVGARGGWESRNHDDERVRSIALTPTVARVWAMLKVARLLNERHGVEAPFCLTVGVMDTSEALLAVLGEGWAEPNDFQNTVGTCGEPNLLWSLELSAVPDDVSARDTAYSIGDRLEDAWGVPQRRYLASRGEHAGKLDARYLR